MSVAQLAVLAIGAVLALVGRAISGWARRAHGLAVANHADFSWRFTLKLNQAVGGALVLIGITLAVGSVIGALFWR